MALARALALMPRSAPVGRAVRFPRCQHAGHGAGRRERILRQNGTTAVLVTHDQDEALSIADLVAVLRVGTIAQVAAPEDLYSRPLDPDLAQFVGEANLVSGRGQPVTVVVTRARSGGRGVIGGPRFRVGVSPSWSDPSRSRSIPGSEGPGAPGRVVSTDFYGHDAVVHVTLGEEQGATPVVARVLGGLRLPPGSPVTLTVRGAAGAWPDHLIGERGLAGRALGRRQARRSRRIGPFR